MKVKTDFVTNSSSTGFILTIYVNELTAREFVEELFKSGIGNCIHEYDWYYSMEQIIESLEKNYNYFPIYNYPLPEKHKFKEVIFGDEDCNPAGQVFDYCLRNGYHNKKFSVVFDKYYR